MNQLAAEAMLLSSSYPALKQDANPFGSSPVRSRRQIRQNKLSPYNHALGLRHIQKEINGTDSPYGGLKNRHVFVFMDRLPREQKAHYGCY